MDLFLPWSYQTLLNCHQERVGLKCSLAPNLGKGERDKRYIALDWTRWERLSQMCRAVLQKKTMNKVQFLGKEGPTLSKVDWSLKVIHNGLNMMIDQKGKVNGPLSPCSWGNIVLHTVPRVWIIWSCLFVAGKCSILCLKPLQPLVLY